MGAGNVGLPAWGSGVGVRIRSRENLRRDGLNESLWAGAVLLLALGLHVAERRGRPLAGFARRS